MKNTITIRYLAEQDLRFSAVAERRADTLCDDAEVGDDEWMTMLARHRDFLDIAHSGGWVAEEESTGTLQGVILVRFPDIDDPALPLWSIFRILQRSLFPRNGAVCEVFNLWVDPQVRRQGVGRALKLRAEVEAKERGISCIYTHTLESNRPTLALNHSLGYREIRRGPIWDAETRVSLLKEL